MNSVSGFLGLGLEPKDLTFVQCSARAVVILLAAIVMVRFGSRRALAEKTVADTVMIVILASVLSRAINGTGPFFPTIGTGVVLVLLHRLLMAGAYHSHAFGNWIKGTSMIVVRDGEPMGDIMDRYHISRHDLEEDLRLDADTEDLSTIKTGRLERSGDISFIKKEE